MAVTVLTWYLVLTMDANKYIGPLHEAHCKSAAVHLQEAGVVCKEPDYMYACEMPGQPGTFTICPHFRFPEVTIRQKGDKQ